MHRAWFPKARIAISLNFSSSDLKSHCTNLEVFPSSLPQYLGSQNPLWFPLTGKTSCAPYYLILAL